MSTHVFKYVVLISMLLFVTPSLLWAKKMYRWVDAGGNVFFSDQIPQNQIQHRREALNESARVIEVVEKAKTQEQIELEIRLNKLRQEQQKIIEQQKSHDKVLLSTFRSVDDLQLALNGKLSALDAQRRVIEGNKQRLEEQLINQQNQAAKYERDGKSVPDSLLKGIGKTQQQISFVDKEISRHLEKKAQAEKRFKKDIARFTFLTQSKTDVVNLSEKSAAATAANQLGLFNCEDAEQCSQAWNFARHFIAEYSTTAADIDTDKLIMHSAPHLDSDISLSASRLADDSNKLKEKIFLDIRCRPSAVGIELCASTSVKQIRQSFNQYITSKLSP